MSIEQYIRQAAAQRGIDPDIAVRVAKSEGGLTDPALQSRSTKNGIREPSYGPFQLLVGGGDTGFPAGMGNDFIAKYGVSPADPANWQKGVDFALDGAARNGWGAWYGAAKAGIGNRQGIGGIPGTTLAGAPQGVDTAVASSGTPAPPLPPPVDVATHNVAGVTEPSFGDKIGTAIWGDNADKLKGLFGEGAKPNPASKGLGLLAGAMGGGSSQSPQIQAHAQPIQSSLPAMEASDGQRIAAGQQLMSMLMSQRKKPGLSLGRA